MKKVFAILAVASLVTFASCKNAANETETEVILDEIALVDEDGDSEEVEEESAETPAK
ncbi:MAG: hypothetical protein LBP96_04080 [Bacteroidales bacterium]|jgi:3-keto-L-gulonate-6-phosphate decarboxylase|nr:hypothetical protein [Bacteroidales bacterium]